MEMYVVIRYGLKIRGYLQYGYTFWLPFCVCWLSFYHGGLFMSGPYSAFKVLTRNCQIVCLSPAKKKIKKFWEGCGNFVKGIYSMILKLSGTFHSSLAEILIFNCVHDFQRCQGNSIIISRFQLLPIRPLTNGKLWKNKISLSLSWLLVTPIPSVFR